MQFKQDVQQWQSGPPKADELFAVKKRIRILRSQLRWKLVEVSCLEEVRTALMSSEKPHDEAAIHKMNMLLGVQMATV